MKKYKTCVARKPNQAIVSVFFLFIYIFLTTVWLGGGVLALNALQDTGLSGQDSWNGAECGNKR